MKKTCGLAVCGMRVAEMLFSVVRTALHALKRQVLTSPTH